jgi:LmbE family N-acetylglucosaminyl deacetylase
MERTTILAVFAHPDDEIGAGSTLAHYADAGLRIVLACASRGEAATIYCDECATSENLAEVRTRELECACEHLGVAELRWLDWPDGGIQALPRDQAVGQVAALIREIRPRVIITHPENGLYPHPDHLAVWEIVRAAFIAAADPDEYAGRSAGPARSTDTVPVWAADRLFTRAIPQSFFDAAPAFAEYRVQLNGQQLPFLGTPDDQIDVVMRVAPWAERRMAAWDCHRSQHNPNGAFSQMPDSLRRTMAENEHFVLAVARTPLPDGRDDDLLAGLEAETPQTAPSGLDTGALSGELADHRAHLAVCERYLKNVTDPGFAQALQIYAELEQEVIYLIARALRLAGEPTAEIAASPDPVARGAGFESIGDRQRFLLAGVQQALDGWKSREAAAADLGESRGLGGAESRVPGGEQQAFWHALRGLAEEQVKTLTSLRGAGSC